MTAPHCPFLKRCVASYLDINMSKAKEMTVNVRNNPTVIAPVVGNGQEVKSEQHYRYLGAVIDSKLNFEHPLVEPASASISFFSKLQAQ